MRAAAAAAPTLASPAEVASLPPLLEAPPLVSAPCPSAVDGLIREWIAKAQRGDPHGGAEEKSLERVKHLFGVLELAPPGGSDLQQSECALLQVFVQLSQFQKQRHIFLHFYQSTARDRERGTTARLAVMKDRKEAGFVYCDAATGTLNGLLIAPEQATRTLTLTLTPTLTLTLTLTLILTLTRSSAAWA